MATKPSVAFTWATDATFSSGGASGRDTKTNPAGWPTAVQGFVPGTAGVAPFVNVPLNNLGGWTGWLLAGSSAGAADAHLVETTAAGSTSLVGLTLSGNLTCNGDVFLENGATFWSDDAGTYRMALEETFWHLTNATTGVIVSFDDTGYLFVQEVNTTGNPVALKVTGGAHTGLTASAETIDVHLDLARTVQHATGDIANQRAVVIEAPTYSAVAASAVTGRAATVAIEGPPVAGTNVTFTNTALALWVQSGQTRLDGTTEAANLGQPWYFVRTTSLALSSVTLADVTGFLLALPVGTFEITMLFPFTDNASADGLKYDFSAVGGLVVANVARTTTGIRADGGGFAAPTNPGPLADITTDTTLLASGLTVLAEMKMTLSVTTAGTLQLRAAKGTNFGGDVTLLAGARIMARRAAV